MHHDDPITSDYAPRHLSRAMWLWAAAGAVALHAGCVALALGAMNPTDPDDDLGAPAIEIGVELMSPQTEPTDLPPGPDAEATAPSPAVIEQKEVVEQTDLPKAKPTETDDPDRVVSPTDTKKPKEDDPKTRQPFRPIRPRRLRLPKRPPLRASKRLRSRRVPWPRFKAPVKAPSACESRGKRSSWPTSTSTKGIRRIGPLAPPRWSLPSSLIASVTFCRCTS